MIGGVGNHNVVEVGRGGDRNGEPLKEVDGYKPSDVGHSGPQLSAVNVMREYIIGIGTSKDARFNVWFVHPV